MKSPMLIASWKPPSGKKNYVFIVDTDEWWIFDNCDESSDAVT